MKILTVIGARPQFIKASMVSKCFKEKRIKEILLHTGQHYDDDMSKVFFDEMGIPTPKYNLGVGSGTQAEQTAAGLVGIERVILKEKPELVLVYGDTNATLAGALAATKLNVPVAHVEAGLRSYNRSMPEEINRMLTDIISTHLFCPTNVSVNNLKKEGIITGVYMTGDVMVDSLNHFAKVAKNHSVILDQYSLKKDSYGLMTIHRPVNADDRDKLIKIFNSLKRSPIPLIFPIHPRTKKLLNEINTDIHPTIKFINPVGYLDIILLEKNARIILTDSGGIQKEAYLNKVPCLTLRTETEWVETVKDGWNTILDDQFEKLPALIKSPPKPIRWKPHYGSGNASKAIAEILIG